MQNDLNHPELTQLSAADGELIDRLLAGEALADLVDAREPNRAERVSQLLSLIERWEADDSEPGLLKRTMSSVLTADPVSLSALDGEALDALLALRRQGLSDGPMPTFSRERIAAVRDVLGLLDRALVEPVPDGLLDQTLQAIEHDRQQQQQRSAVSAMSIGGDRQGGISIRQIATTAALLLMSLSLLLPMLNNAQRDAKIAQCGQNLAGLGSDLQRFAFDNKDTAQRPAQAGIFDPLSSFARSNLDGTTIPMAQTSFFVLMDQKRIDLKHMTCPTTSPNDAAGLYNGQNPVAGGPFRMFAQARPIFADTNPLYRVTPKGLIRDASIPSLTRSANHAGTGQNVLISDGSVKWMLRPAVSRDADTSDNIWLYQPNNNTDGDLDIFLTP